MVVTPHEAGLPYVRFSVYGDGEGMIATGVYDIHDLPPIAIAYLKTRETGDSIPPAAPLPSSGPEPENMVESPVLNKTGDYEGHGVDGPHCRVCHVVHGPGHTYYRDCRPCARCGPCTDDNCCQGRAPKGHGR